MTPDRPTLNHSNRRTKRDAEKEKKKRKQEQSTGRRTGGKEWMEGGGGGGGLITKGTSPFQEDYVFRSYKLVKCRKRLEQVS
ncbi:hypothetical protein LDENG_00177740 [Lucifuga dentata]|nr:hypothetical protein LDENG_00177740 [Lucifuga dentata]